MSATFGGRPGRQSRISQWLRGRRPQEAAGAEDREALLLAAAAAGLPLAPAAHPVGYRCSCERVGCPTPARHPLSFAWQTQSTTDPAQVGRWLSADPEANFITATGMLNDVLDVPLDAGRAALERLLAEGIDVGPVAESDDGRMLFFTQTRGTPEDEDEWWPCELDSHPETDEDHPGLRWHCRGSYVLVPPARLPGDDGRAVRWVRGPEHALPEPLLLLEALTDAIEKHAGEEPAGAVWPLQR
ncbi:bifunctional DNA primase/polymerase [Streptomyces sp. NPDC056600]|uniref:bifunctional DNA primase/polymerase n=1 Tax=Streptomyces sp. NPDC056600 TaxID=3345874 RepID=UPI00369AE6DB